MPDRWSAVDIEPAQTVQEATEQRLPVPTFEDWWRYAHTLSGYRIAEELGFSLGDFASRKAEEYRQTGRWSGSALELRLVLFFEARALRFSAHPGYDPDEDMDLRAEINSLLNAIHQQQAVHDQP